MLNGKLLICKRNRDLQVYTKGYHKLVSFLSRKHRVKHSKQRTE